VAFSVCIAQRLTVDRAAFYRDAMIATFRIERRRRG
jgi:hypothetical protein